MKAPTLRDIAAAAGVSHVTVSLALRNQPRIPLATRERIQAAAEKMGYRPNPLLRVLSSRMRAGAVAGYSPVIAFINPFRNMSDWQAKPTLRKFQDGAKARAEQLGYTLETFWLGEAGMSAARLNRILEARGIHAAVLGMLPAARGHLSLSWEKLAVATQGYSVVRPAFHRSCHHHSDGMAQALRHARKLGARRIGFVLTTELNARTNHLWLGTYAAMRQFLPARQQVEPWLPEKLSQPAFRAWLEKQRPDFVITAHTDLCRWTGEWSNRVGATCRFAHLDLHPDLFPDWMGIDQNQAAIGARAIELVIEQLHLGEFGVPAQPKIVLTPGRWVAGCEK